MELSKANGIKVFICLAAAALLLAGCASGPAYVPITQVPADKALLMIYRPPGIGGAALTPDVDIAGEFKFPLTIGGYYPYFVKPGNLTLAITGNGTRTVALDAKGGQTYYVKGGPVPMGFGVPAIEIVPPEQGAAEIKECKLLTLPPAK